LEIFGFKIAGADDRSFSSREEVKGKKKIAQ